LYSSGTVAGALEGASWGIPSVALSMHIHEDNFDRIKEDSIIPHQDIRKKVDIAARLGADFANQKIGEANEHCEVYNINFPTDLQLDTPWVATQPGKIYFESLFQHKEGDRYRFRYTERIPESSSENLHLPNDYETFVAGNISLSILDFNQLGKAFAL
jgi:5'/3'-nucleotidase SurE